MEYWKSIGKTDDDFSRRIGVRFGEWKDTPFTVWLSFPYYAHRLEHVATVEQVEQLHALLKGER